MTKEIKKIAVIGAGTMGSGIAAQAANAGVDVVLLDKFEGKAEEAIERMVKAEPKDVFNAGLMVPENARFIKPGTNDENMDDVADADLIVFAILAPQHIRADVYKQVQDIAKPDAIFADTTSAITWDTISAEQDDDFRERFVIAHFFNPVRRMHLLEMIRGSQTKPDVYNAVTDFGDRVMGKKIVESKDVPCFIGNRLGMYPMERAKQEALRQGVRIEDVDSMINRSFGFDKLGLFRLADEVGLPVILHVMQTLSKELPEDDAFHAASVKPEQLDQMIEDGYLGNRAANSKGGYYRVKKDADGHPVFGDNEKKPLKETLDLETGEYRDYQESQYFKKDILEVKTGKGKTKKLTPAEFFDSGSDAANFVWPVLRDTLLYALNHAEDVAYDVQSVDDAMRAGFNWDKGPFELLDWFGVDWFKNKLVQDEIDIPALLERADGAFYRETDQALEVMDFADNYAPVKREEGVLKLEDIKRESKPLVSTASGALWDIGDGVTCFEFTSPMNTFEPSLLKALNDSLKFMNENSDQYKAMVLYNEGKSYSIGANLHLINAFMKASKRLSQNKFLKTIGLSGYFERQVMKFVGEMIYQGQAIFKAMREAPFPVIGAPRGNNGNMAFGGGCESLLWCDAIQSGPESIIGLVEAGVGLIPGWGGSTRYLDRAANRENQMQGPMPAVVEAALALVNPKVSTGTSTQDSKKKLWLSPDDGMTMNPDRVLADAKAKAMSMAEDHTPPKPSTFRLPGPSGRAAIRMKVDEFYLKGGDPNKDGITHVDVKVAEGLANILTGGDELTADQVDRHVASHHDHIKKIIEERPDGSLAINPTLELTEERLLALEWQRIMTLAADPDTQARIAHTVKTNKPLREEPLNPKPTTKEIRDSVNVVPMHDKIYDGKPLTGEDARRLDDMAEITETALKRRNFATMCKLALLR